MGLASIKIEGLQDLYNKLDEVSHIVDSRAVNSAFLDSAQILLDAQKRNAPEDTGQGKRELKIGKVKTYRGYKKVKVGLEYGNWSYGSTNANHGGRGIWYQHWGYTTRGGRFIAGSHWMDDAFQASEARASAMLISQLSNEIARVWR